MNLEIIEVKKRF